MKSLLIVGAGEFGQLVKEIALDCGYQMIDFLDDNSEDAIGKVSEYKKFTGIYSDFTVAIGNPEVRKNIVTMLENDFCLATLINPESHVSRTASVGIGSVIEPMAVVNTGAVLGKACFVNAGAVVNHNSAVGDFSQIDCNAVVAARAEVPEGTKVMSCTVWNKKPEMPAGEGTFF